MIQLQYFTPQDFTQLITWINDEEILMNWSGALFSFPLTPQSLTWYIEDVNDIATSEAFVYKAIDTTTGKVIGHISLGGISKKNKSARISRVFVDPEQQGKGYCRQMVSAVLKIGFEELKLHRICLGVYDFNKAAISCYKKAGLVVEGVSRDCLLFKGAWWSLAEMSMLEEDWNILSTP
jgi:RimJ/RimL family protein N-acetyltransferase